jgi:YebC/PmpR family DNA-binding regulatory protein
VSGHSKWATIKRKKGKLDAQRGRIFTKLIKEITVAARQGGGDPESNARLRTAIASAKAANMPQDNIKKATQKGTGELPGVAYDEVSYEGYGPGGVAILMEVMTDNKNRTVAEVRHILSKRGGNLGETGCVNWMFEKKGFIQIETGSADEEKVFDIAIESGATDMTTEGEVFAITTPPDTFESVRSAIEKADISIVHAEVTMVPQTTVQLDENKVLSMLKLMEELEDHDDIQNVYANFDIDDELLEKLSA